MVVNNSKAKVKSVAGSNIALDGSDLSTLQLPKPPKPPSRPVVPYLRYSSIMWNTVKDAHPHLRFNEIGKIIGAQWRKMTDEEKQPYRDEYTEDKLRFKQEMKDYKNSDEYREYQAIVAKLAGNKKANVTGLTNDNTLNDPASKIKIESLVIDEIEDENETILMDSQPLPADYRREISNPVYSQTPYYWHEMSYAYPGTCHVQQTQDTVTSTLAIELREATSRYETNDALMNGLFEVNCSAAFRSLHNPTKDSLSSCERVSLLEEKTNAILRHAKLGELKFKEKEEAFAKKDAEFMEMLAAATTITANTAPIANHKTEARPSNHIDANFLEHEQINGQKKCREENTKIKTATECESICQPFDRRVDVAAAADIAFMNTRFTELKPLDISFFSNDSGIYDWYSGDNIEGNEWQQTAYNSNNKLPYDFKNTSNNNNQSSLASVQNYHDSTPARCWKNTIQHHQQKSSAAMATLASVESSTATAATSASTNALNDETKTTNSSTNLLATPIDPINCLDKKIS